MSINQETLSARVETVIPLSPAQKWWHWARQPILNVEIHGVMHIPVEMELFHEAWRLLLQRHPLLRAVFPNREQSENMLILENPGDLPVTYENLSDLEERYFWEHIKDRIAEFHSRVELTCWPLIQVGLFKRGDASHIVLVLPTLIGDILMVKALSRDFTVIYRALQLGLAPPSPGAPDDYGNYVRFLDELAADKLDSYVKKWTNELPLKPLALPCDHRRGGNTIDTERMHLLSWDLPPAITGFEGRPVTTVGIYSYLWLALVRVLQAWTGREDITVCERTIGRDLPLEGNLFKSVGFYAVDYPVCLQLTSEMPIREQLETVSRTLEQGSLNGAIYNYAYGLEKGLALPHELTPVRIDFFGRADSFRASGVELLNGVARFGFDGGEPALNYGYANVGAAYAESARRFDRLYEIDLSGFISGGTLLAGIYYSTSMFRLRSIQAFAAALSDELTRIAEDAAQAGIRCAY